MSSKANLLKLTDTCSDTTGYSLKYNALKQWLAKNNLTQREVAETIGLSACKLKKKLWDKEAFSREQIKALLTILPAHEAFDIIYFPTIDDKRKTYIAVFGEYSWEEYCGRVRRNKKCK